ncbi:MAG TPA: lysylphosphatidylglycerol synthase transmembrane domain-containing protein [Candidatus Acidoferrales bacterium]|nr:lysylphosphatidylglycerol synthase transmembrane domain-containing protein [Candidatus Acidoferrales bacterium]
MRRSLRRYLILLVALLALAFFLYKFRNSISIQGFHWSVVAESLRHARIELLILAVLTIYACFAVRSLRWMRFSRSLGPNFGRDAGATSGAAASDASKAPQKANRDAAAFGAHFWNVYSATLMGFSCTFLLGRAGEPIRPVLIGKKESLPIPSMFGVYVLERIADMAATAVLAGTALILLQRAGGLGAGNSFISGARSAGIVLLILLIAAIAFLIYFRYHGAAWLERRLRDPKWRSGWREKAAVLLEGFSDGLQGIRTWGDLGMLLFYTAIHWIGVVFVYVWVAHAFQGELGQLTFADAVLVLAFTLVGSAVQLPGVGGGAQLATFLVLTLIFGVQDEAAATMAIIVWLIGFASCCPVGLPLLFREGWSMGDLRRMAKEEERAGEAALLAEAERGPVKRASPGDRRS